MRPRATAILASGVAGVFAFAALIWLGLAVGGRPDKESAVFVLFGGLFVLLPLSLVGVVPWRIWQARAGAGIRTDLIASSLLSSAYACWAAFRHTEPLDNLGIAAALWVGNMVTAKVYWWLRRSDCSVVHFIMA